MRILFVSAPFAGHLNPLIALAGAARDSGHETGFVTGRRKEGLLRSLGFAVSPLASVGVDSLEAIANWPSRVAGSPRRLLAQLRQNLELLPAIRADLLRMWRAETPGLVVADFMAPVAGSVCDEFGIPWITTIPTPFAIEQSRGTPSYCGGWPPGGGWRKARDAAGRWAVRNFKNGVAWRFRREFAALGLSRRLREDGTEAVYSPRAILGFGIEDLEFERDWPPAFRMIGPVIDCPETPPPLELGPGPNVLVTLGTHLPWAKQGLAARVVEVASSLPNVRFEISMGVADEAFRPPERAAANVRVHQFIAYPRDLARFDAVIHHGGAGVTYAAILAGVPSIVVPHDYDQFDFAARVLHHGLGLRARRFDARDVTQVLEKSRFPALGRFQRLAARYRPAEAFLETVRTVTGVPARAGNA